MFRFVQKIVRIKYVLVQAALRFGCGKSDGFGYGRNDESEAIAERIGDAIVCVGALEWLGPPSIKTMVQPFCHFSHNIYRNGAWGIHDEVGFLCMLKLWYDHQASAQRWLCGSNGTSGIPLYVFCGLRVLKNYLEILYARL